MLGILYQTAMQVTYLSHSQTDASISEFIRFIFYAKLFDAIAFTTLYLSSSVDDLAPHAEYPATVRKPSVSSYAGGITSGTPTATSSPRPPQSSELISYLYYSQQTGDASGPLSCMLAIMSTMWIRVAQCSWLVGFIRDG